MDSILPMIFLSYSWKNKKIADEVDDDLSRIGVRLTRDIRDSKYRTSLSKYMHTVRNANFVIALLSDEFLKSQSCLLEVMELLNSHSFDQRVLPILHSNVRNIYEQNTRVHYYEYWQNEFKKFDNFLNEFLNEDFLKEKRKIQNICANIDTFFKKIIDLNTKSFEELKAEEYNSLLEVTGISRNLLVYELHKIDRIESDEKKELALDLFLKSHPDFPNAWFYKAFLASSRGQKDRALAYYRATIDLDSTYSLAHVNVANILYYFKHDHIAAKEHLEIALKHDPHLIHAKLLLSVILNKEFGDNKSATTLVKEVIDIDPDNLNALFLLAELYFDNGSYGDAIEHLEKHILLNPENDDALALMGDIYQFGVKDYKCAIKFYERTLEINDKNSKALNHLGCIYFKHISNYSLARDLLEKAITLDCNDVIAHLNLANLLESKFHDYDGALSHLHTVISLDENNAQAYNMLVIFGLRNFPRSEMESFMPYIHGWYVKAITLNPSYRDKMLDYLFYGDENDA